MKKRRLFVTLLAVVLALLMIFPIIATIISSTSALAVSQTEINALEQQKESLAGQKTDLQSQILQLQEEQAAVVEQKAALDAQNELTRQEIEMIDEQIDLYEQLIIKKEAELEEAIEAEQYQIERYRTRMRAMEENGQLTYIGILFKATSFSDFLARADVISEIMDYDRELEADLMAAREHVQTVKAEFEQAKVEEEAAREELLRKKEQLEREIKAAYEMILELEKDIEAFKEEFAAQEAEEARVQAQIDNMIAELQRQEEEARKAAESAGGGGEPGTVISGSGSYIWPLPSSTYVSSGFGYRIHPIFQVEKFHSGIDAGGSMGAPVVSADSGTVLIAAYSSSYGNYISVSHGNGNSTLYAHLSSMAVSAGQAVNQGDVIGYVGSTGWSTGPHLHFETRAGGALVNPGIYFPWANV